MFDMINSMQLVSGREKIIMTTIQSVKGVKRIKNLTF